MKLPTIRDHMATVVHTFDPDDDIIETVQSLIDNHVTGAPVVRDDQVVGIISEKDCLKLLAHGDAQGGRAQGTVADYMSTEIRSVHPDMNIYFVAGMFLNDHVRRFPVIEDGRLVGAITRFDILRIIRELYPD